MDVELAAQSGLATRAPNSLSVSLPSAPCFLVVRADRLGANALSRLQAAHNRKWAAIESASAKERKRVDLLLDYYPGLPGDIQQQQQQRWLRRRRRLQEGRNAPSAASGPAGHSGVRGGRRFVHCLSATPSRAVLYQVTGPRNGMLGSSLGSIVPTAN